MSRVAPDLGSKHFAYIDGFRGLLAAYVLCHHFLGWNLAPDLPRPMRLLGAAFSAGHAAVCAFIVLSGFSLMLPVAASPGRRIRGGLRDYVRRRARRLLPAYYAALALSIGVAALRPSSDPTSARDLSAECIGSHLLLIHTWVPGQHSTLNMALWSVATEWHIYFLFPLVLLPAWRRLGRGPLLALAFGLGALPQLALPAGSELLYACPWFLGLFATGMVAAVAVAEPGGAPGRSRRSLALGAAFAGAYLGLKYLRPGSDIAAGPTGLQWVKDGAAGAAVACALAAWARLSLAPGGDARRPLPLRLLESAPARCLGLLSYSLYATHCAVLELANRAALGAGLGATEAHAFRALVGLPVALGVAHAVSLRFEVPFLSGRARPPEAGDDRGLPRETGVAGRRDGEG